MNYQDELQAKLDAVRSVAQVAQNNVVSTETLEEKILLEIEDEFEFGQYDLDESDILRTLKIMDLVQPYGSLFLHSDALKIFYIIAKIDVIKVKNLHNFFPIEAQRYKKILSLMVQKKLIFQNENKELELTLEGRSLAQRLGIFIF